MRNRLTMALALVALVALVALFAASAEAVPTLQLYIPGSTYNPGTESWLSFDNPFTVQVLGSSKNNKDQLIADLYLHVAIPQDWWEDGSSIHLSGPGYESGVTISDWIVGQPEGLSPHGVYPTYYHSFLLPDMDLKNGTDVIHNYNPGEDGQDVGVIYAYTVSYSGAFGVHLDASGELLKKNGKWRSVFAPYSHDADAPGGNGGPPVPEPASLSLIGVLLAAMRLRAGRR